MPTQKRDFLKNNQLKAMAFTDNLGIPTWAFQGTHYWTPKIQ